MESMPENSSGTAGGNRTRAKSKATKSPVDAAVPAKKARAPRKTPSKQDAALSPVSANQSVIEDIDGMIATAAYYLAAARNFTPGYELDDWLTAERTIRARPHS